jgi:BMFP domain-containing protein YqiC
MEKEGRLFDDLARVAGGAMSSLTALREEIEARLRDQFERMLANMELVRRDEFEAVRAMAEKAREENEALAARLAALEGRVPATAEAAEKPARAAAKRPRKAPGDAAKKG